MLGILAIVAASAVLWVLLLIRIDPHRGAEGTAGRVVGFFLLGMLSVLPAGVLYILIPYHSLADGFSLWDDFLYMMGRVGPIEEVSKFLVFLLLVNLFRTIREPEDGIYQAAAVGLGFAIVENVRYGLDFGPRIALLRSFVISPSHMLYASLWGFIYAARIWANPRVTARDRALLLVVVLPAAFVHGLSNFLANFGSMILWFDLTFALAASLVLVRLREESHPAARNLQRPRASHRHAGTWRGHDLERSERHLRAAHIRLRAGDALQASRYLDRYLTLRPNDPYSLGMKGATCMLAGDCVGGEFLLVRAEAMMPPRTRHEFRRDLRRITAPAPGRRSGGFDESMLRTWLVVSDLNRERIDPRPRPPRARGPSSGASPPSRAGPTRA
jgi:RsiW-degrading membrane proteinase PrsW (M82 family)